MKTIFTNATAFYIVLIPSAVLSLIFCIKRAKGFSFGNLIFKTVASLSYILTGITAFICNPKAYIYAGMILFGGVLGLCGDVMLDLKGLQKEYKDKYMLSGFIFFLLSHIIYATGIIVHSKLKPLIILICFLISIVISSLNYASAKITKYEFGKFKFIVWLYTVFLAFTAVIGAAAMIVTHFETQYILLTIGGVMFMLSDAILSGTYFGKDMDKPFHYFINHFTYYAAQFLIMSSIIAAI